MPSGGQGTRNASKTKESWRWLVMWTTMIMTIFRGAITGLIFVDVAVAAISGHGDVCKGSGKGSPACQEVVNKVTLLQSFFTTAGGILLMVIVPFVGILADKIGSHVIVTISMIAALVESVTISLCSLFGISVYFAFITDQVNVILPAKVLFNIW